MVVKQKKKNTVIAVVLCLSKMIGNGTTGARTKAIPATAIFVPVNGRFDICSRDRWPSQIGVISHSHGRTLAFFHAPIPPRRVFHPAFSLSNQPYIYPYRATNDFGVVIKIGSFPVSFFLLSFLFSLPSGGVLYDEAKKKKKNTHSRLLIRSFIFLHLHILSHIVLPLEEPFFYSFHQWNNAQICDENNWIKKFVHSFFFSSL